VHITQVGYVFTSIFLSFLFQCGLADIPIIFQNKKRKYDRDDREDREKTPEEPAEDPLKDATTLYVGNL